MDVPQPVPALGTAELEDFYTGGTQAYPAEPQPQLKNHAARESIRSASAKCRRLIYVHSSERIGSLRVAGPTRCFRSAHKVASARAQLRSPVSFVFPHYPRKDAEMMSAGFAAAVS